MTTPSKLIADERLATLVGCIHGLVLEFDERGTYLNAWTDEPALLARPPDELIGRTINEVLGSTEGAQFMALIERVFRDGKTESFEYSLPLNGAVRWFLADAKRVGAANGSNRVVFFARDITERKRSEQSLRASEQRHRLIAQATSDVLWDLDLTTEEIRWSAAMSTVFGYPTERTDLQWWDSRIHPDDHERVVASFQSFIDRRDRTTWREEYRLRLQNGTYADVDDRGCIVFSDAGTPLAV